MQINFRFPLKISIFAVQKEKKQDNPLRDLNQDDKGRHYQQDC